MKVHVHGSGHLAKITDEFLRSRRYRRYDVTAAAVVWACEDVDGLIWRAEQVINGIQNLISINPNALFLISSQLPVGTIRLLESQNPGVRFACCPENFKATDAYLAYREQQRFIVGVRRAVDFETLMPLFNFSKHLICTSIESAEMTKHAINAYLGLCISFINEIKDICDVVGADILDVERGLRSDNRVSQHAPLRAGEPFGGGHIDRDLGYLRERCQTVLINAIYESNHSRCR